MIIKFGLVTEFDAGTMRARVKFQEDGMVSDWLPVTVMGSKTDKFTRVLYTNERVVCLMGAFVEDGVIVGSIYDDSNLPPDGETGADFGDGGSVAWADGKLTVIKGTTKVEIASGGVLIERGGDSLGDALTALVTAVKTITVTCAAPGSPSTIPLNIAAIDAAGARITNILT